MRLTIPLVVARPSWLSLAVLAVGESKGTWPGDPEGHISARRSWTTWPDLSGLYGAAVGWVGPLPSDQASMQDA